MDQWRVLPLTTKNQARFCKETAPARFLLPWSLVRRRFSAALRLPAEWWNPTAGVPARGGAAPGSGAASAVARPPAVVFLPGRGRLFSLEFPWFTPVWFCPLPVSILPIDKIGKNLEKTQKMAHLRRPGTASESPCPRRRGAEAAQPRRPWLHTHSKQTCPMPCRFRARRWIYFFSVQSKMGGKVKGSQ